VPPPPLVFVANSHEFVMRLRHVACCPGSYCLRLGLAQTSRQKRRTVAFSQLMLATSWPSPSTTGMFSCWVTFDLARQDRATDSKSLRNIKNTLQF